MRKQYDTPCDRACEGSQTVRPCRVPAAPRRFRGTTPRRAELIDFEIEADGWPQALGEGRLPLIVTLGKPVAMAENWSNKEEDGHAGHRRSGSSLRSKPS